MTAFPALPVLPRLEKPDRYGIALIGAGAIVNAAHLPAYHKAGFRVEGIMDLDRQRATQAASRFGLGKIYSTVDELAADEAVQIVDIAVPPQAQEMILPGIVRSGRHVLCQKPLAETVASAQQLVRVAHEAGMFLAVNLNLRWCPAIRALRHLLGQGLLGQLTSASFQVNFCETWETWPWLQNSRQLLVLYDAIHLVDCLRYLFGEPDTVFAVGSRTSSQRVLGETQVVMVFRYSAGFTAFIHDSSNNWAQDTYAEFRVEGTNATAKGILGGWYDYPIGRADQIEFVTRECPDEWIRHDLAGRWVPDAFAWSMAEIMESVSSNRSPLTSGQDHIKTLQLVEAIYQSMETGEAVHLKGEDD